MCFFLDTKSYIWFFQTLDIIYGSHVLSWKWVLSEKEKTRKWLTEMMAARMAQKTVICIFWSISLITSIIFNMSKLNCKLFVLISFLGFGNTFISFAATCCAMCCCDEEQMYHGFLLFCSLFVIISQATILNVYIIAFFRGFRHQVRIMSKHICNCTSRIRFWHYQFWSIL